MDFLLADGNVIFAAALLLMLTIALMEGVLTLMGLGLSQLLDSLLPDVDVDADVAAADTAGAVTRLLGWMRFGDVPAMIVLVLFLTFFALSGLTIQWWAHDLTAHTLPGWIVSLPALLLSVPLVRFSAGLLHRVALKDESQALSRDDLAGHLAVITVGVARQGSPAEARVTDRFGTTHYIMVEPLAQESLQQGEQILLLDRQGAIFRACYPDELP